MRSQKHINSLNTEGSLSYLKWPVPFQLISMIGQIISNNLYDCPTYIYRSLIWRSMADLDQTCLLPQEGETLCPLFMHAAPFGDRRGNQFGCLFPRNNVCMHNELLVFPVVMGERDTMHSGIQKGGRRKQNLGLQTESLETGDRCSQMAAYAAHSDSLNNLITACFST